jgi:hypothetical protein
VHDAAFLPGTARLVSSYDLPLPERGNESLEGYGYVAVFDVPTGRLMGQVRSPDGSIERVVPLSDGRHVLCLPEAIAPPRLWTIGGSLNDVPLPREDAAAAPLPTHVLADRAGTWLWQLFPLPIPDPDAEAAAGRSGREQGGPYTPYDFLSRTRVRVFRGAVNAAGAVAARPRLAREWPTAQGIPASPGNRWTALSPSGEVLYAIEEGELRVLDARHPGSTPPKAIRLVPPERLTTAPADFQYSEEVVRIAVHPGGRALAAVDYANMLTVYSLPDGRRLARRHFPRPWESLDQGERREPMPGVELSDVAYAGSDGRRLVVGLEGGLRFSVLLLDARDLRTEREFVLRLRVLGIRGVTASDDGRFVAAWGNGGLEVFDIGGR